MRYRPQRIGGLGIVVPLRRVVMDRQSSDEQMSKGNDEPHHEECYSQFTFEDMGVTLPQVVIKETTSQGEIRMSREPEPGINPDQPDWPPVSPRLRPMLSDQGGYPSIPGDVGRVVEAFHRASGCSRPIAALLTMASLSVLAAGDWRVRTTAPDPKPPTFHVLGISESGWRKSTAMLMVWKPHATADREVHTVWRDASDVIEALPSGQWTASMLPRESSPQLMRSALKL